jgi:hypothetical protein
MCTMENAWLALVLFVGVLGAGCGSDVCSCGGCSHPAGACPSDPPGHVVPMIVDDDVAHAMGEQ